MMIWIKTITLYKGKTILSVKVLERRKENLNVLNPPTADIHYIAAALNSVPNPEALIFAYCC